MDRYLARYPLGFFFLAVDFIFGAGFKATSGFVRVLTGNFGFALTRSGAAALFTMTVFFLTFAF